MSSFFKKTAIRSRAILNAARGEDCTLRVPGVCLNESDTVVACHSNSHEDGHGKGIKSADIYVAFGCARCHAWLDNGHATRDEKRDIFHRGMKATWLRLVELDVVKIKGVNT